MAGTILTDRSGANRGSGYLVFHQDNIGGDTCLPGPVARAEWCDRVERHSFFQILAAIVAFFKAITG